MASNRRLVLISAFATCLLPGTSRAQDAAVVMTVLDAMVAKYPRTVTSVVRLPDGEVTQKWEIGSLRRFHFVQTPAGSSPELYVWDNTGYLRVPTGWYRKALNKYPIELGSPAWLRRGIENSVEQPTRLPDAVIDRASVRHYSSNVNYKDAVGVYKGRFEIWVSPASLLPVRSTFSGSYGEKPLKIETAFDYITLPQLVKPQPVINPE